MIILTLRTDKPEAEAGLYDDEKQLAYVEWQAHRQLGTTIHKQLQGILNQSSIQLKDIAGIVAYKGPGSFTGLRIGLSVANALAYAQNVPVVAVSGDNWQQKGIQKILAGQNDKIAIPEYGASAITTVPKK